MVLNEEKIKNMLKDGEMEGFLPFCPEDVCMIPIPDNENEREKCPWTTEKTQSICRVCVTKKNDRKEKCHKGCFSPVKSKICFAVINSEAHKNWNKKNLKVNVIPPTNNIAETGPDPDESEIPIVPKIDISKYGDETFFIVDATSSMIRNGKAEEQQKQIHNKKVQNLCYTNDKDTYKFFGPYNEEEYKIIISRQAVIYQIQPCLIMLCNEATKIDEITKILAITDGGEPNLSVGGLTEDCAKKILKKPFDVMLISNKKPTENNETPSPLDKINAWFINVENTKALKKGTVTEIIIENSLKK